MGVICFVDENFFSDSLGTSTGEVERKLDLEFTAKKDLPCSLCNLPIETVLSYVSIFDQCSFTKEDLFPHKSIAEDPMHLNYCNS